MYVLAPNQNVEKYPYSFGELRKDNPQVSFPSAPTVELLASYNVFPVVKTDAPEWNYTINVREANPVAVAGVWMQAWAVTDATPEEIAGRTEAKSAEVRDERNQRLSQCDWTQVDDAPLTNTQKAAWASYRQSLRDMPSQEGFPWSVVWPATP